MVPFTPVLANSHGKREFGFSVSVLQAEWVRFGCDGTLLFCCHIKEPHTEGDIWCINSSFFSLFLSHLV